MTLGACVVIGLVASAVAFFEERRRVREASDRLMQLEEKLRDFDLSATLNSRLETPRGVCDPLYTKAYDPTLPLFKSKVR